MSEDDGVIVPIWTLTTTPENVVPPGLPDLIGGNGMTPARLADYRNALAAFSAAPLVTLEARPLLARSAEGSGLPLHAASPLAKELSRLISSTESMAQVPTIPVQTETLYRMVVPAKVAAEFGAGAVKPMASKVAENGIHGDLVGKVAGTARTQVVAKATYVPVTTASAGTGAGATAVAAAGTSATAAAVTVAAPLVLMAVAVGASAYADQQRQKAIENITDLLEQLHDAALDEERSELEGCRDAIEKATAILLDRGRVGASLGLDSAVHEISTATAAADRRLKKWERALDGFGNDRVELAELEKAFPGVTGESGLFRAHVELAYLAIALKRRVVVLQAVEAGQSESDNPFEHFLSTLKEDQRGVDKLEGRLAQVLGRLSALELKAPKRLSDKLMTRKGVDSLLASAYRLRALQPGAAALAGASDVVIEIERYEDGDLVVLPAVAVS